METTKYPITIDFPQDRIEESWLEWIKFAEAKNELKKRKLLINRVIAKAFFGIKIEDFHIGFKYEEYEMDCSRYLNKGMIWVKKTYGFTSPRLFKIQKQIDLLNIRKSK